MTDPIDEDAALAMDPTVFDEARAWQVSQKGRRATAIRKARRGRIAILKAMRARTVGSMIDYIDAAYHAVEQDDRWHIDDAGRFLKAVNAMLDAEIRSLEGKDECRIVSK